MDACPEKIQELATVLRTHVARYNQPDIVARQIFRSVCAGLIPSGMRVKTERSANGGDLRLLIWSVMIGNAVGKTWLMEEFKKPLCEIQDQWEDEFEEAKKLEKRNIREWRSQKAKAKKEGVALPEDLVPRAIPRRPRIALGRVATSAYLVDLAAAHPDKQITIFADMLSYVVSALDPRYSLKGGIRKALEMVNGVIETGANRGFHVNFSLFGSERPGPFADFIKADIHGLRFKLSVIDMDNQGLFQECSVIPSQFDYLQRVYKNLAGWTEVSTLTLDPEALKACSEWHQWIALKRDASSVNSDMRKLFEERRDTPMVLAAIDWCILFASQGLQPRADDLIPALLIQSAIAEVKEQLKAEIHWYCLPSRSLNV